MNSGLRAGGPTAEFVKGPIEDVPLPAASAAWKCASRTKQATGSLRRSSAPPGPREIGTRVAGLPIPAPWT
jgi:hypothetical protein